MKVLELVESARSTDETPFAGTPDKRSARIVAAALQDLGRRLEKAEEGRIVVAGFGSFVVRDLEGKAGGAGKRAGEKRIVFRPSRRRTKGSTRRRPKE